MAMIILIVTIVSIISTMTESLANPTVNTCQQNEQGEILQNVRNKINVIIDTFFAVSECGDGLWYRVAYLNMSDPLQQCPSAWREYNTSGVRACGRPVSSTGSCPATVYSINLQYKYNQVCGRVIGYQVTTPDTVRINKNINQIYIDGVSIIHGSPRSHIWSYAGAWTEIEGGTNACPCRYPNISIPWPSFIGDNYYRVSQLIPVDSLQAVNYFLTTSCGMVSSAAKKVLVVPLSLPHGSVWSFLILQVITLKYAFVAMKALTMKILQLK